MYLAQQGNAFSLPAGNALMGIRRLWAALTESVWLQGAEPSLLPIGTSDDPFLTLAVLSTIHTWHPWLDVLSVALHQEGYYLCILRMESSNLQTTIDARSILSNIKYQQSSVSSLHTRSVVRVSAEEHGFILDERLHHWWWCRWLCDSIFEFSSFPRVIKR